MSELFGNTQERRWYIVQTYSGYENKVKADLEHRIETYGLSDQIVDIKIPTEEVTEIKEGGKRETKESKVLPSYVLVRMEGNDDTWSFVRNTPGVTGFVGVDGKPAPLSREEFNKIMRRSTPRAGTPVPHRTATNLEPGMTVRVLSGPLADFDAQVTEVNAEAGKGKVVMMILAPELIASRRSLDVLFRSILTTVPLT
mgnify:CR=1 FL=1